MIDFHTHILPGIDDGSQSVEMSLQMLRMSAQQGVDTVIATPHFSALLDTPEVFVQRRAEALASIPQEPGLPRIIPGAEVAYFNGMSRCEELPLLKIGDSELLLVEMPFGGWTDHMIEELCAMPRQLGLMPVLAHVERYARKDQYPRYAHALLDQALIQCNAASFLEGFARHRQLRRLAMGDIHFLGSDCHNTDRRAPNLGAAAQQIRKKYGDELLQQIDDLAKQYLFADEGASA